MSAGGLLLPIGLGDWLLEHGLFGASELATPPTDTYMLTKTASQEFENGMRIARLLQVLSATADADLDMLKEVNTPVAKLYNWNVLLPKLRQLGIDVDQDMKVLIVAGDLDMVVDLLEQLQRAKAGGVSTGGGVSDPAGNIDATSPPPSAAASTSIVQFIAFCCRQELGSSWNLSLQLARNHRQLGRQQAHGAHNRGGFVPIVRWFKLVFANCKHLAHLCALEEADATIALAAAGGGLASSNTEVALWCSRLLCRLAAELTQRGDTSSLWSWFSRPGGGAAALLDAWRLHPDLHSAGALMPIALHFSGENLAAFFASVLPRHASSASSYISFTLELVPLLSSTKGTRDFVLRSGTLKQLLHHALAVVRRPASAANARGLGLELLAELWSQFTRELQVWPTAPAVYRRPPYRHPCSRPPTLFMVGHSALSAERHAERRPSLRTLFLATHHSPRPAPPPPTTGGTVGFEHPSLPEQSVCVDEEAAADHDVAAFSEVLSLVEAGDVKDRPPRDAGSVVLTELKKAPPIHLPATPAPRAILTR